MHSIVPSVLLALCLASTVLSQSKISMEVTSYGFDDNTPPSDQIAYPNSSYNTQHEVASGVGYYWNAITMATNSTEIPIGTIVYLPFLRKYFVMEDDCTQCDEDWENGIYHIDLWMGPDSWSDQTALDNCEDFITRSATTVIIDPPQNLEVDPTPLFSNGACTANVYD